MNFKKMLSLICFLIIPSVIFCDEKKFKQLRPKPIQRIIIKQNKKPKLGLELIKGLAALSGFAFFIYALMNAKNVQNDLMFQFRPKKTKLIPMGVNPSNGKQRFEHVILKNNTLTLPIRFMSKLSESITSTLGFSSLDIIENAENSSTAYTLISALGSIICGKYGFEKLYNVLNSLQKNLEE